MGLGDVVSGCADRGSEPTHVVRLHNVGGAGLIGDLPGSLMRTPCLACREYVQPSMPVAWCGKDLDRDGLDRNQAASAPVREEHASLVVRQGFHKPRGLGRRVECGLHLRLDYSL